MSIALEEPEDDELVLGVTFDPMRDELFHAVRGEGAFLNGHPIRVSATSDRMKTFFVTGFPFRSKKYLDDYLKTFRYFFTHARGIRRAGSAALDLAYVAAGRADAFWELTLSPWDMAAGIVLVEEAGGKVTDFFGGKRLARERTHRRDEREIPRVDVREHPESVPEGEGLHDGLTGGSSEPLPAKATSGRAAPLRSTARGPVAPEASRLLNASPRSALAQTPLKNPARRSSFLRHSPLRSPWKRRSRPIQPPAKYPAFSPSEWSQVPRRIPRNSPVRLIHLPKKTFSPSLLTP